MKLEAGVVYGPMSSRRFGWDLGINLLPANRKFCTFDCVYCQFGFTGHGVNGPVHFPEPAEILSQWEEKLILSQEQGLRIRHTTIAGNGEPTMHPRFLEIVEELVHWRNERAPYIRLAVLSNGYRIHISEIRYALSLVEEPILKLDSADPEKLMQINQPQVRLDLNDYIQNLKKCSRVILQTLFLKGWNDGREDLNSWIEAIRSVCPESVQIYSIDRPPARPDLEKLTHEELTTIAREASIRSGVPVQAFT